MKDITFNKKNNIRKYKNESRYQKNKHTVA